MKYIPHHQAPHRKRGCIHNLLDTAPQFRVVVLWSCYLASNTQHQMLPSLKVKINLSFEAWKSIKLEKLFAGPHHGLANGMNVPTVMNLATQHEGETDSPSATLTNENVPAVSLPPMSRRVIEVPFNPNVMVEPMYSLLISRASAQPFTSSSAYIEKSSSLVGSPHVTPYFVKVQVFVLLAVRIT